MRRPKRLLALVLRGLVQKAFVEKKLRNCLRFYERKPQYHPRLLSTGSSSLSIQTSPKRRRLPLREPITCIARFASKIPSLTNRAIRCALSQAPKLK